MPDAATLIIKVESRGVKKASAELNKMTAESGQAETATKRLTAGTKKHARAATESASINQRLASSFTVLKNAAVAYYGYSAVKTIAQTGLEFDRMERSLFAATESMSAAKIEMEFLRSETNRIGVDLLATGKAYSQLTAAAKGTEISQQEVRDIFTSVSEASVVLGLSADDTKGAMRALVQVMSKGSVQAEELRGQLGERFPGAFQAAARAMKVTTQELNKMLEQGEVMADDFIPRFAKEIRRTYAKAVPAAMDSAQAAFARLHNAMAEAQNELAQGGLLDGLATASTVAATATQKLIDAIKDAADYTAALSVGQISAWEYAAGGAKQYFKVLSTTPVVKDTFLGAAAGWLYDLGKGTEEASVKLKTLRQILDNEDGGRFKIERATPTAEKTKTRKELADEKRASDRAAKEYARLLGDLQNEEEAIEESYQKRMAIINKNSSDGSELRAVLSAKAKQLRDNALADIEEGQQTAFNSLQASLHTEEEAIRDSYARRIKIVEASTFAAPEVKSRLIERIAADQEKQLSIIRETKAQEFHAIAEGLRTEEELIKASYDSRRAIIEASTIATIEQKQELLTRLNEEFATEAMGMFAIPDTYEEEVTALEQYFNRRRDLILSNTALTEEERTALELALTQQRIEQLNQLEAARMQQMFSSSAQTFGALANLAKEFKGEQSKEYKAMFAASQAFEIAQAIMKTYDSATGAYSAMSSIPYVGPALGAAAAIAAVGAGMANVAQIRSQSYSGAYDSGGIIPRGSVGLVGEIGPEIVSGPANVTSRKDTAALLNKETPPAVNNIRIINAFDSAVVGDYIGSDAGEKAILNVVKRNQSTIQQMMG